MLSDGHAVYTPGLSENRGGTSSYGAFDVLGNLWFMDNASGAQTYYQDTTAFGSGQNMGIGGTEAGPFKFGGANGCQTDADTGLVLMGHRYYDTRIGRFITQDHAKSGGNWYAYAGNNPMNKTDPSGLTPMDGPGSSPVGSPGYDNIAGGAAGWAENSVEAENFRDNYNQQVDQMHSVYFMAQTAGLGISEMMGAIAPQMDDLTGSASYGVSISLGRVRFTGAVGVAYDFYTGKVEFFRQYGAFIGSGRGLSSGLGFTLGNDTLGNFGGFNGPSLNFDYLSGSHGVFGFEGNMNYVGIEFSPPGIGPFRYTQFGDENGIFGGVTNTVPFGPIFTLRPPPITTLHF